MAAPAAPSLLRTAIPLWRDLRVLRVFSQVVFVVVVVLVGARLYANMRANLERQGLVTGYDFLGNPASFDIGERLIPYAASDTYGRAFLVGVLNTVMVSIIGIALATVAGVVMGVARLSPNWLIRQIAAAYVLLIRNTPLLLQLFFWYFGVVIQLPKVKQSIALLGSLFLNQRGLYLPWPVPTETFDGWKPYLMAALIASFALWLALNLIQKRLDRPLPAWWGLGYLLVPAGIAALGWALAPNAPLAVDFPVLKGLNFKGGLRVTPELFALLTGLVIYTGAFIAEVVRAGIQAVSKSQTEAARALGLKPMQILRLVIFPQALRVIIPPLTSQYLNLAKNSTLAVAIGYPDLYSVSGTIFNQTGKAVEVVTIIMGSYLVVSLTTSLLMNIYNKRMALVER
ncbi:MAG: ABC transporter permease subunit [Chloroflexi bacterium]|nr:ABC transporter permease subunit [Chloroflexota bacterium]MBI5829863.1 ABC transporter permease subunit [Chloroflexota bacterium]